MKTSIEVITNEIKKPHAVLRQTNATKLDIAMLADHIQILHADTCGDLERTDKQIHALEDKVTTVDHVIQSIDENIARCQNVITAVRETLDIQTGALETTFKETEREHQERYAAIDEKMNAMAECVRSIDERNSQHVEAMQSRIQALEERIPKLETEFHTLGTNVDRIERVQHKINARILTVMRLSLIMIGVLVAAAVVAGVIFYK